MTFSDVVFETDVKTRIHLTDTMKRSFDVFLFLRECLRTVCPSPPPTDSYTTRPDQDLMILQLASEQRVSGPTLAAN